MKRSVCLALALMAAGTLPAAASERPVLHRYEAMSQATFAAPAQLVQAPAVRCWDKPGSSPSTRTCRMTDGSLLRVHEQHTGYVVWRLGQGPLDLS